MVHPGSALSYLLDCADLPESATLEISVKNEKFSSDSSSAVVPSYSSLSSLEGSPLL